MTTQLLNPIKPSAGVVGEFAEFEVVLVKDDRDPDYAVFCPALPGCGSQGDTRAEALAMIADAIAGYMAYRQTRPVTPASRKDDLIAEFIAAGATVEVATVRVCV